MNLIIAGGLTIRYDLLRRKRNELFRCRFDCLLVITAYCCMLKQVTVYFDSNFMEFGPV